MNSFMEHGLTNEQRSIRDEMGIPKMEFRQLRELTEMVKNIYEGGGIEQWTYREDGKSIWVMLKTGEEYVFTM